MLLLTKDELKRLISANETRQAIQSLLEAARTLDDQRLLNDVIHQSSRLEQAKKEEMLGTSDPDDVRRQLARIHHALLEIIDRMPKEPAPAASGKPAASAGNPPPVFTGTGGGNIPGTGDGGAKTTGKMAWLIGLALLVGMVLLLVFVPCPTTAQFFAFRLALALAAGGLATLLPGMFGLELANGVKAAGALGFAAMVYLVNPGELVSSDQCNGDPFNFTVRLQKPDLPNYPPLARGNLRIWVVNRYEKPELNSDLLGEVKGIPASEAGKKVDVSLEGATYWKLAVDSVTLSKTSQTLRVVPDGSLDTLSGKVTNADGSSPLPGVTVEVEGGLSGVSDAAGRFAIAIPAGKQKEMLLVSASKTGFVKVDERHNPASGDKAFSMKKTGGVKPASKKNK